MAKPEWGAKHHCNSCSKIFYDMKKDPIICPSCGKKHIPEVILKPGRSGPRKPSAMMRPVKPVVAEGEKPSGVLLDDKAILKEDEPNTSDDDDDDENQGDLGVDVSRSSDKEGLS